MGLTSDFFHLIFFSSFLISLSSLASASESDETQTFTVNPSIKNICDKTTNPDICSSTIVPYLDGKTDAQSVFRMQATAAMHKIEEAIDQAKNLAKDSKDKATAERLKGCADSYRSALDDYRDALKALDADDPGNLAVELSSVVAMLSTCDDTITDDESLPASTNPMSEVNQLINKMNDNCFDMRHIIYPQVHDP